MVCLVFVHSPIEITEVWEIYPTNGHGHNATTPNFKRMPWFLEFYEARLQVNPPKNPQKRILTKTLTPNHLEKLKEIFFKSTMSMKLDETDFALKHSDVAISLSLCSIPVCWHNPCNQCT